MPTDTQLDPKQSSACWSCTAQVQAHFCTACGKVQPPEPSDYFSFFGLQRKLDIDVSALEREFYKLSRGLHPDLFARATPREQEWSLEQSSRLNDAYRTLRDPIARTEYLLELEGVQIEEQSKKASDQARATGQEKKQVVPPDLLEEVFELNMQLEEMRMSKASGETDIDTLEQLRTAQKNFEQRMTGLLSELQRYWKEWDALPGDVSPERRKAVLDRMLDLLNRRSYIRNLLRDVNAVLA